MRLAARARAAARAFSATTAAPARSTFARDVAASVAALGVVSAGALAYMRAQHASDVAAMAARPLIAGNPIVFLDVADGEAPVGRLVFQLRADAVPRTAENFRVLATGALGWGYKGSPLHGCEKGRRVFGGDFFGAGAGGFSIYGDAFPDEGFAVRHAGPGVLGMRAAGRDANNSQFYVTLKLLPELDGRSVAVGELLEGLDVLERLDRAANNSGGRFGKAHDFRISASGELKNYAPERARAPRPVAGAAAAAAGAAPVAGAAAAAAPAAGLA
jgi:cyclophilin family peptidyl-prolyl cis-trans isomerase